MLKVNLHLTIDFIMSFATTNRMVVTIHRNLVLEYFNLIYNNFFLFVFALDFLIFKNYKFNSPFLD